MKPFDSIDGIAAALPLANVDTDNILPGRFLKTVRRAGLGAALFAPLRYAADGLPDGQFVLNQKPWADARVLVALDNFGCGSSREHAPWALLDFGIRAIIAPSFADIFRANCVKNGILPAIVDRQAVRALLELVSNPDSARLRIDLPEQSIRTDSGEQIHFAVDAREKAQLLSGENEISRSLERRDEVAAHFAQRRRDRPWVTSISLD